MGAEDKSYYRNQREEPGLSGGRRETDLQKKVKIYGNEMNSCRSYHRLAEHLLCKNQHKQRYVSLTWSSSEMMDRHKSASTKEGNTPAACFLHCLQFHFLWPSSLFQLLYSLNWTLISASQNKNATRAGNHFYPLQNNIYKRLISDVFIWYRL